MKIVYWNRIIYDLKNEVGSQKNFLCTSNFWLQAFEMLKVLESLDGEIYLYS